VVRFVDPPPAGEPPPGPAPALGAPPPGPAPVLDVPAALPHGAPATAPSPVVRGGAGRPLGRADGRELVVVGGLDAGRRFALPAGTSVVGRGAGCDIPLQDGTLSRRHAALIVGDGGEVEVEDLGSHNGTWRGDRPVGAREALPDGAPLRLGALDVEVRPVRSDDRPLAADPLRHTTGAGTIPFNRPPRPAPPPAPDQLRTPKPPQTGQGKVGFSLISTLAPVAMAGAMYLVMHSARVLMFAGLTPVMGMANMIDGRRKGRRSERAERERFAREMRDLRTQLATAAADERDRREAACPDPPEVARRATLPSTTLWERRPAHLDFLVLRAGVGDVAWKPPVQPPGSLTDAPAELREALDAAAVLAGSPVAVDLSGGGVVGIVGHRGAALALARSLLCQAATLHGPADMPVMVLARPDAGRPGTGPSGCPTPATPPGRAACSPTTPSCRPAWSRPASGPPGPATASTAPPPAPGSPARRCWRSSTTSRSPTAAARPPGRCCGATPGWWRASSSPRPSTACRRCARPSSR
jgi:S-DNA-T family DNA segregation ATPase FtsK/SpoIIIE